MRITLDIRLDTDLRATLKVSVSGQSSSDVWEPLRELDLFTRTCGDIGGPGSLLDVLEVVESEISHSLYNQPSLF